MKTAHQLARELLAGPDLPIYHFDPSRAGLDDENDTSLSYPKVERNTLDAEGLEAGKSRAEELGRELLTDWLTISGKIDDDGEAAPTLRVICGGQGNKVVSLKRVAPNQFLARPMSQDDDFGLKVCPGDILEIS